MQNNLINLIKGNKDVLNYVELTFKLKNGNYSAHKMKIAANQAYNDYVNDECFSRSGLQNFFRKVNEKLIEDLTNANNEKFEVFGKDKTLTQIIEEKKSENLIYLARLNTWLKLKDLNISYDEILFSHIDVYGKEKELTNKSGKKEKFSVAFFHTILDRYKLANNLSNDEKLATDNSQPEIIETVVISEKVLTPSQKGRITRLNNSLNAGKIDKSTFDKLVDEIKNAA